MMNKEQYIAKLETLKVTDETTVAQLKENKKVERALRKFWEMKTIKHVVKENNIDWAQVSYGRDIKFIYNLKPVGTIKMQVWFDPAGWGDFGAFGQPPVMQAEYVVRKADLL